MGGGGARRGSGWRLREVKYRRVFSLSARKTVRSWQGSEVAWTSRLPGGCLCDSGVARLAGSDGGRNGTASGWEQGRQIRKDRCDGRLRGRRGPDDMVRFPPKGLSGGRPRITSCVL